MLRQLNVLWYLLQIWRKLPGNWEQRKQILFRLAASIRDYCIKHPRSEYNEIVARFGTPQQIAETHLNEMDSQELIQQFDLTKRILVIVRAIAFAIILAWLCFVCVVLVDNRMSTDGFIVEEVEVISEMEYESGGN